MRLLVDSCAGARLAHALRDARHDVAFAGDWHPDPGDEDILRAAVEQKRIVITRDKDFGALVFRDRYPHYGIVRLVRLSPEQEVPACLDVLNRHVAELEAGAIVTVDPRRTRIRVPTS